MKIESTAVKADRRRLYEAIERRGLKKREISREMGFHEDYISSAVGGKGQINGACAIMLEKFYGIKREEYEIREEPEKQLVIESELKECEPIIDYERLYKTIYAAVFHAVKRAWEDGESDV